MSCDEPTTPVTTRVEITSGGHQVIIETIGGMSDVAKEALELWRATDDKALTRGYGTVGFHTELSPDPVGYVGDPESTRVT